MSRHIPYLAILVGCLVGFAWFFAALSAVTPPESAVMVVIVWVAFLLFWTAIGACIAVLVASIAHSAVDAWKRRR